MPIRQLSSPADLQAYDAWIKSHPDGTLWQSLEWKTYQEKLGREVRIFRDEDGSSALVVIDKTTLGLSTWDIPRGPLQMENGKWKMGNFISKITKTASREKCISIYFSPQKLDAIFHFPFSICNSPRTEQPPATRLIDLQQSDEEILAQMKQKGRYNIRVAEKHGISVRRSDDIDAFARLAAETAHRDGFRAPPAARYKKFLESLPNAFLLLAFSPSPAGEGSGVGAIAGLLGVLWNGTGIYYYGASDYAHRALMAPYLLQWEAIKLCKAAGCHTYDLLGIASPSHPVMREGGLCPPGAPPVKGKGGFMGGKPLGFPSMQGITRFKEQFGGTVVEYPPEQQILLKPWANRMLQLKRKFL